MVFFGYLIGSPVWGAVADKFGRKRVWAIHIYIVLCIYCMHTAYSCTYMQSHICTVYSWASFSCINITFAVCYWLESAGCSNLCIHVWDIEHLLSQLLCHVVSQRRCGIFSRWWISRVSNRFYVDTEYISYTTDQRIVQSFYLPGLELLFCVYYRCGDCVRVYLCECICVCVGVYLCVRARVLHNVYVCQHMRA